MASYKDDEDEKKKLPIAGQMVANTDDSKRAMFLAAFNGNPDPEKQKRLDTMKRRMLGSN